MRPFNSAKRIIEASKDEIAKLYRNPNTRYAMIGIVGALVILAITFFGLRLVGKEEPVDAFLKRWKEAVESRQPAMYQALWDSKARSQNQAEYERALKLIMKEKVEADLTGISPRKDFKQPNRYEVEHIPVTLYQDNEVLVKIYRDLTIEKKGIWQRWKLINDQISNEMDYPEASSEPTAQAPTPSSNTDSTTSMGTISHPTTSAPPPQATTSDLSAPFAGTAPVDTQLKVRQVLGVWQKAWQEKDLDTYMSTYAEDAAITRVNVKGGKEYPTKLTKAELREKMKTLNKRYGKVEVLISNVRVNGDSAVANVGFLQEFIGTPASGNQPAYSDYGTKTLIFMIDPTDGQWKIYSENWSMYEDVPKYPKL